MICCHEDSHARYAMAPLICATHTLFMRRCCCCYFIADAADFLLSLFSDFRQLYLLTATPRHDCRRLLRRYAAAF